jgi:mannose-1-phosphate guanylyltransferase/phosphomannomutase
MEEREPRGTAGGVKNCEDFIGEDDVLVISGDAVCDFDLTALMREHLGSRAAVTMALSESADPLRYGLVLTDSAGEVVSFVEKPDWSRVVTDLVNTGVYILSPLAVGLIPHGVVCDFAKDLFPKLLDMVIPIRAVVMEGYWCDVGSPAAYLRCNMDAHHGRLALDGGGACLGPGIRCAAKLAKNVQLHPPCHISAGARIGEGAVIGPEAVVGPGSLIGAGAVVRASVIDGGEVGAGCTVEGAIVCRGAHVVPGASVSPGSVVAAPGAKPAPDRPPLARRRGASGLPLAELDCADRARLMRRFSEAMMESGAAFDDGLILSHGGGKVRISPAADRSAVVIESLSGRTADLSLAARCVALAKELEE